MDSLTSIDYARLISWYAWNKHGVLLGKTQLQKILYICYGVWLAYNEEPLFAEKPVVWPFGPVFPDVYVWYSANQPQDLTQVEIDTWARTAEKVKFIFAAVDKLYYMTAKRLTEWSHRMGSPWAAVANYNPWGTEIPDDKIKEYFKSNWAIGL